MLTVFASLGFFGSLLGLITIDFISRKNEVRRTRTTARELVSTEKEQAKLLKKQTQVKLQEYEVQRFKEKRDQLTSKKEKNIKIQSSVDKIIYRKTMDIKSKQEKIDRVKQSIEKIKKDTVSNEDIPNQILDVHRKYLEELKKHSNFNWKEYVQALESESLESAKQRAYDLSQYAEDAFQKDLEKNTRSILECVINRFSKSSCHERGIYPVQIKNKNKKENENTFRTIKDKYINQIEKQCGVDIIVNEDNLSFAVQGLDSVRREWGRLSIERIKNKNKLNDTLVSSAIAQCKKELFKKIKKDGVRICQNLKLSQVSEEVCNMLGALRYRYSFAQNQHFHCEEVGYLCGLLQAEFDSSIEDGRRAGLFHDIGKAMDHAQTGGHAVIGADFIQKHGEKDNVVYAVRGHHHDVPPTENLDFFVIAADAISGARPGARRSTVDAFEQKVLSLERIGKSFKEVQNLYVMNGGRELRVIVDHKKVSDEQALDISKKLAHRIEEECSYPGWIKVTVVRKVENSQQTRVS